MTEHDALADQFEENRGHLRGVAYRMLGSLNEADDAVQEAWLRLSRCDAAGIGNLSGWLTTVVARVCLDMLRSRASRREEPLDTAAPERPAARVHAPDPEQEALLADSVGVALLVVLDRLEPAERLAFVMHDMFAVPFEEIALIVGRSPEAARQLASRARRRVQGADTTTAAGVASQRKIVDAFLAAVRAGDFDGLLAVLDPNLTVHVDAGAAATGRATEIHGAATWARQAISYAKGARFVQPMLVNGELGLVLAPQGRLLRVLRFTFEQGKIAAIEIFGDRDRIREFELAVLNG